MAQERESDFMEDVVFSFIEYLSVQKGYSDETIKGYERDLELFHTFLQQEHLSPLKVTYQNLRNYLMYLYNKQYSKKTISRTISTLRTFYKYLCAEGKVKNNPCTLITNPKLDQRLPNYVNYKELDILMSIPDETTPLGQRDALILEMLYSTGMRVSELVHIKLGDLNHGEIRVLGKGNKERIVLYGKVCEKKLIQYAKDGRSKLCKNPLEQHLFLNKNGKPLSVRGVELIFETIVKKSGLKIHVSPHTFRHTFATHMLNEGADLKSVQDLLGHENLSTTQVYTHVSNERIRQVYLSAHPRAKEGKK